MNTFKFAGLISISLFLSACGGGGSDSSPAPTPPPVATTYTVSASAGTGGSISPSSRSVTSGQTTTFTVTANTGYDIAGVTGCGGSLSGNTYTTGAITSACSVSASFTQKSYEVTATAGEGGSITPASISVKHGETTSFTVAANTGYDITSVTGCGGSLSGNTYTTGAITSACSVSAAFTQKSYEVTATAGEGGSITPASISIKHGETTSFTVTANTGYEIDGVTGCGGSLNGNTYTTGAITNACSVESTFKKLNFTVSVTTSGSGTVSSAELTVPYGESGEITTTPAENNGVYQIEGCDGSFDVSSNLYTTGAINENCSISVEFEGLLTGEISGPEVFLLDTDGAFELTTVREVETEWVVSKSPETATADVTEVDAKNVTIAADKNGEYEVSVTMTRGYLSTSVEAPFKVATPLSDNIEEDKQLLLSESPYLLTKDIFIRQEKTLSAEPGVELYGDIILDRFNREIAPEIEVFGTLDFQGESDKKVSIDGVNINPGKTQTSGPYYFIKFRHVLFQDAEFHNDTDGYGYLDIRNSDFQNLYYGVNLWWPYKHTYFIGNTFVNSGGIRFLLGSPLSNPFLGNGEDKITIENNLFVTPPTNFLYGDYAISNHGTASAAFISVQKNSFYTNGKVAVRIESSGAFDAPNNYWGTTDEEVIKKMIFDLNDDPALTDIIEYMPFLTEPHPDTPVYSGN